VTLAHTNVQPDWFGQLQIFENGRFLFRSGMVFFDSLSFASKLARALVVITIQMVEIPFETSERRTVEW
jgi:hypothetical protein